MIAQADVMSLDLCPLNNKGLRTPASSLSNEDVDSNFILSDPHWL
jgi:hypothetical protein